MAGRSARGAKQLPSSNAKVTMWSLPPVRFQKGCASRTCCTWGQEGVKGDDVVPPACALPERVRLPHVLHLGSGGDLSIKSRRP
eukprot:696420-Prorocentrum_minimum.AAC.1